MINFIIHEPNKEKNDSYRLIIFNALGCRTEKFRIHNYNEVQKKNLKNTIYLLGTDKYEKIVKIAKSIRDNNDWHSQIIIITDETNNKLITQSKKLLIFDYININDSFLNNLKNTITKTSYIITADETIDFMINGEIYKIPYKDILFIEKENNLNHSIIYTKNEKIKVNSTIKAIEEQLGSPRFFKTHRSCIINLDNVTKYQYNKNNIYFNSIKTSLISRDKKQILKEKLLENKVVN